MNHSRFNDSNAPTAPAVPRDWRPVHGVALLAGFGVFGLLPDRLLAWPLPLVVPLAVYFAVVLPLGPLRRSTVWLRPGICSAPLMAWSLVVAVISCGSLVGFHLWRSPDLAHLDRYVPLDLFGVAAATVVLFPLLNAALEEAVFRGILYDAFLAGWSWKGAVAATSVLFGLGHLGGYPPGWLGGALAGLYGVMLALLRHHSGGLALPIVLHVAADATIMGLRLAEGSPGG